MNTNIIYPTSFGTDKIFCYASHPKIGVLVVIHAKNDAKEEEEEKEEEKEEGKGGGGREDLKKFKEENRMTHKVI